MRKVQIKLFNAGDGLLDARTFTIGEGVDEEAMLQAELMGALSDWTLAVGDTIKIEEV